MFCPKCGKEVKDGAMFCAYCGAPVEKKPAGMGSRPVTGGIGEILAFGAQSGGSSGPENTGNPKNRLVIIGAVAAVMLITVGLGMSLIFSKVGGGSKKSEDKASANETEEAVEAKEEENIVRAWECECKFPELLLYVIGEEVAQDDYETMLERYQEEFGAAVADRFRSMKIHCVLRFEEKGEWSIAVDEDDFWNVLWDWTMDTVLVEEQMEEVIAAEAELQAIQNASGAERAKLIKESLLREEPESYQEMQKWMNKCACLGTYQENKDDGEIELEIEKAWGKEKSGSVLLGYRIKEEKLSLEVLEDNDGVMERWQNCGFFDKRLIAE